MMQIRFLLPHIISCSAILCSTPYALAQESDPSPINIVDNALSDGKNVNDLNAAIEVLSALKNVSDLEIQIEKSQYFVKTFRDVVYNSNKEKCDVVTLANSKYILSVCYDRKKEKIISEASEGRAKKIDKDFEIQPVGR